MAASAAAFFFFFLEQEGRRGGNVSKAGGCGLSGGEEIGPGAGLFMIRSQRRQCDSCMPAVLAVLFRDPLLNFIKLYINFELNKANLIYQYFYNFGK